MNGQRGSQGRHPSSDFLIPIQLVVFVDMASLLVFIKPLAARRASLRPQAPRPLRAARTVCMAATVDKVKVLDDVRAIVAEQLAIDTSGVGGNSTFADLGADSLDTVEIMMALEERFEIQIDEAAAENISTVGEAADQIATQIAAK